MGRYYFPFAHKIYAVVVLVLLHKVHDVSVLHKFRCDRNWCGRRKHNAHERQDVLVAKPLPSNDFFDEELCKM